MKEQLYTVDQAAKLLSLSPSTIRHWIFYNKIEYVKLGRAVRIKKTTIDKIIKGGVKNGQ